MTLCPAPAPDSAVSTLCAKHAYSTRTRLAELRRHPHLRARHGHRRRHVQLDDERDAEQPADIFRGSKQHQAVPRQT
jgi:hypothetical protein